MANTKTAAQFKGERRAQYLTGTEPKPNSQKRESPMAQEKKARQAAESAYSKAKAAQPASTNTTASQKRSSNTPSTGTVNKRTGRSIRENQTKYDTSKSLMTSDDFDTTDDYIRYLQNTLPQNENGNQVSEALKEEVRRKSREAGRGNVAFSKLRDFTNTSQDMTAGLTGGLAGAIGGGIGSLINGIGDDNYSLGSFVDDVTSGAQFGSQFAGSIVDVRQQRNNARVDNLLMTPEQQQALADRQSLAASKNDVLRAEQEARTQAAREDIESGVLNAADFAEFASAGMNIADADYDRSYYENMASNPFNTGEGTLGYSAAAGRVFERSLRNPATYAKRHADELLTADLNGTHGSYGIQDTAYLYMDEQQVQVYSYLAAKYGRDRADEYYNTIKPELEATRAEIQAQGWDEWAAAHPGFASAISVGTNLGQVGSFLNTTGTAIGNIFREVDQPVDPYNDWTEASRMTNALREGAGGEIAEELVNSGVGKFLIGHDMKAEQVGQLGNFLYGTGMSMIDCATNLAVFGPDLSLIVMSSSAAGASAQESAENGLSASQGLATSIVAGAAEYVTEKMDIDRLLGLTEGGGKLLSKEAVKNVIKGSGAEGTEELVTSYINTLYDISANGSNSAYERYIAEEMANGKSRKEAEEAAKFQFFFLQPVQDFEGGALSGLGFNTVGSAYGSVANNRLIQSAYTTGDAEISALADKVNEQYRQGSVDPYDREALAAAVDHYNALPENERLARSLAPAAENGSLSEVEQVAYKVASGQEVTTEDVNTAVQNRSELGQILGQDTRGKSFAVMDNATEMKAALNSTAKSNARQSEAVTQADEEYAARLAQIEAVRQQEQYESMSRQQRRAAQQQIFEEMAQQAAQAPTVVSAGVNSSIDSVRVSNTRKAQLQTANAALKKLGISADINVKDNILTQAGRSIYDAIKGNAAVENAMREYLGDEYSDDLAAETVGNILGGEMQNTKLGKAVTRAIENGGRQTGVKYSAARVSDEETKYTDYNSPITEDDIETLRSIGRKSINDFTSEDIQRSQKWAHKFWQQLGTKSPFFRAWFGDWRASDTSAHTVISADMTLQPNSGNVINKDTDRKISWSKDAAKESVLNASKEAKADIGIIASNMSALVENAVLLDTVVSEKKSGRKMPNTAFMHSMYSLANVGNKTVLVKIFAEEALQKDLSDSFLRAYSLKYIEKVAELDNGVLSENGGLTDSRSATKYTVSDLFALVKQYDGDFHPHEVSSELLNDDGTPKEFYHGTPNGTFTEFKNWQYFTENESYADVYQNQGASSNGYKRTADNPKTYGVYIKADKIFDTRNPADRAIFEDEFFGQWGNGSPLSDRGLPDWTDGDDLTEFFEENGYDYDAVLLDEGGTGGYGEEVNDRGISIVVRDSSQIKSADDNIGTFDRESPDIRFAASKPVNYTSDQLLDALDAGKLTVNQMREVAAQLPEYVEFDFTTRKADMAEELAQAVDMASVLDSDLIFTTSAQESTQTQPKRQTKPQQAKPQKQQKPAAKQNLSPEEVARNEYYQRVKKSDINIKSGKDTITAIEVDISAYSHGDTDLQGEVRKVGRMASANNREVRYYVDMKVNGKGGFENHGFIFNGVIYLNAENLTEAYTRYFGHELCHDLISKNKDVLKDYYNLRRAWAERNGTTDEFEARMNDIINNRLFDESDPNAAFEELMCDDLGDFMTNEEFARFAVAEKRTLWQKITYAVGRMVNTLRHFGLDNRAKEYRQLHAFMLDALNEYRGDGRNTLARGIQSDAKAAMQTAKNAQGRYQSREYRNIQQTKWQNENAMSDEALKNVTKKRPYESTEYGYKKIREGDKAYRVYVVNPNGQGLDAAHKANVEAVRGFAAATGMRIAFTTGNAIATDTDGKEYKYKYDIFNDNGTLYVNLSSADSYTALVGAAWYNEFAKNNPARGRTLARLVDRMNRLNKGNTTAQGLASRQITSAEQSSYALNTKALMTAEALKLKSADLLETLSGDKRLLNAVATEDPTLLRRAADSIGDFMAKISGKGEARAEQIMQQAEANILYALSRTAETNVTAEGEKVPAARKNKKIPQGMQFKASRKPRYATLTGTELLAQYDEQSYNRNGWAYVNKVMTHDMTSAFLKRIAEIRAGSDAFERKSGGYIVDFNTRDNGVMIYTDGSWDAPSIDTVIVLENADIFEYASKIKEDVYAEEKRNIGSTPQIIQDIYGTELVRVFRADGFPTFQEQKSGAERSSGATDNLTDRELQDGGRGSSSDTDRFSGTDGEINPSDATANIRWAASGISEDNSDDTSLRRPTRFENRAYLDDYADRYGTIPEGENINSRGDQNVPARTAPDNRVQQTVRTYLEALSTTDDVAGELEYEISNGTFSYSPITNESANRYADTVLSQGHDEAMATWNAVVRNDRVAGKREIALGERLIMDAIQRGDVKNATKMISEVAAEATRAGQIVQAISMVKRLSPAGQFMTIQRQVDNINKDIVKTGKKVEIGEAEMQKYAEAARQLEDAQKRIQELEEQLRNGVEENDDGFVEDQIEDARDEAEQAQQQLDEAKNDIIQNVADQTPVRWIDRFNAWRYLAMLGNPRTHIRNIVGNAVFVPAVKLKQAMTGAVEAILPKSAVTERTTTLKRPSKSLREFAANDASQMLEWLKSGGKYNVTDTIQEQQKSFTEKTPFGKALNAISDFNGKALDAEDAIFLKYHYQTALAKYAAANNISAYQLQNDSALLNKARAYAAKEAQKATYRDMNAFSDFMSSASRQLKSKADIGGKLAYAMFEGVIPFKKTPCNIVKRSMEYSPIGITTAISKGIRKLVDNSRGRTNDYTANEFIDDMAAGMTGTMLVGLGALFARLGMLRGRDKDKEDEFEKLQGAQEYSFVLGDSSYTIDWMAPTALPLFVGAELHDQLAGSNEKMNFSAFLDSLVAIVEPMFNLSMLDGVQSALQSYNSEGAIVDMGWGAAESFVGQFFPTIGGQIARSIDSKSRNAYYNEEKATGKWNEGMQVIRSAMSKTPGLEQKLPEKIDAWGRNAGEGQSTAERVLENFISPGYYSRSKTTDVDRLIQSIYDETGDASVLPKTASHSFSFNSKTYYMSADEYVEYAITRGQTAYNIINEMRQDPTFDKMPLDKQADCIDAAYALADYIARLGTDSGFAVEDMKSKWQQKACENGNYADAIIEIKNR